METPKRPLRLPSHTTVAAYLALFLALCTGVGFAATQIKSSKQIRNGIITGADIRNETVAGIDIRNESVAATEVKDGGLSGFEIADESLTGADVDNNSLTGADIAGNTVTGDQVSELSLQLGGYEAFDPDSENVDNGLGSGVSPLPETPEGDIEALALAPGRYFIHANAIASTSGGTGGLYCNLDAGDEQPIETGAFISATDFDVLSSTPTGVSAAGIFSFDENTVARFYCSDAGTGVSVNDRTIQAIRLGSAT